MHPFEEYLQAHSLEPLAVSIKSGVRYVTIWNAIKGNPITSEHARKVQQTVLNLTGIPYTGPLAIMQERSDKQLSDSSIRKLHLR
jgi:hypothetical protein